MTKTQEQDLFYRKKRVRRAKGHLTALQLRIESIEMTLARYRKTLKYLKANLVKEETKLAQIQAKFQCLKNF